jgi:CTP:molybdopterin cytidylyltransferase MocA
MENKTVFVLLAGGKSERMGVAKGLLEYKQTYWILEQLNRISKTTIKDVYIGLGHNYQQYFDTITWFEEALKTSFIYKSLNVKVVINLQPELGSFSTLQTVLKQVPKTQEILLNPIDIPLLNSKELQNIIDTKNEIAQPNFEGKNGHPIKMKPSFWNKLTALNLADEDARLDHQLKKLNPIKISTIEVSDRVILYNLNTKSAWKSYLQSFN